jgi:hypothetical protein
MTERSIIVSIVIGVIATVVAAILIAGVPRALRAMGQPGEPGATNSAGSSVPPTSSSASEPSSPPSTSELPSSSESATAAPAPDVAASTEPDLTGSTTRGRIVAVRINPSSTYKRGPNTYSLPEYGNMNFRYGWTVISENGELDSDGCYVKGTVTRGTEIIGIDKNTCGGGWNEVNLKQPGNYRVTVAITTDWGARASKVYDFQVDT